MENELNTKKNSNQAMVKICGFIVDKRNLFFPDLRSPDYFFCHIEELGRGGEFHGTLPAGDDGDEAGPGSYGRRIYYIRNL